MNLALISALCVYAGLFIEFGINYILPIESENLRGFISCLVLLVGSIAINVINIIDLFKSGVAIYWAIVLSVFTFLILGWCVYQTIKNYIEWK